MKKALHRWLCALGIHRYALVLRMGLDDDCWVTDKYYCVRCGKVKYH